MIKKMAVLFLLGGGGWLIWRALTTVDRGITDGQSEQGFAGGLIDAAYGLGDGVLGAVMGSGLNESLSISLQGLAFIKGWETLRLMPYYATAAEKDNGVLTIGWGHTYKDSDLLQVSRFENGITQQEAERLFIGDVSENEGAIRRGVKVKLNQAQFDALVSFRINAGHIYPSILKPLNNGDFQTAGNAFMNVVWQVNKKTGEKKLLPGLYKRRSAEVQIWFNAYYNSAH